MVDKKDLVIAVLAASCLTFTLFSILPSKSSPSAAPYDPWLDTNDDGTINMRDIGAMCNAFGTYGDPTKNVNVTNWPEDRPGTIKKGIQRIIVMDSLTNGVLIRVTSVVGSNFYFEFAPMDELINITDIYINAIWKASDDITHPVLIGIYGYHEYGADVTRCLYARACTYHVGRLEGLEHGLNRVQVYRPDGPGSEGDIYLYRLELLIEYFYLG